MAKKNRNILKGFFETGKKPTEGQYANLIDSFATLDSENTGSFDLKGNTILDGHLTASGGITASGTLVIGGEISASGGISSSGIIQAQRFIGDGTLISNITSSQVNIQGVTASFTSGAPTGSLIVSGNLFHPSASTNILMAIKTTGSIIPAYTSLYDLGSPTNHWNHLFVSNSFAKTYTGIFNGALSGSSLSSAAQGTAVLNTNGVAGSTIDLGLQTTDSVAFHSITASNDISASGDITASGLMIHGDISASGTVYANNFQSVGGDVAGISFTDDLNLTGDLTASGNISASGTITAASMSIGGVGLSNAGGAQFKTDIKISDGFEFRIGDGPSGGSTSDMTLYHDGTDSYIKNNTGELRLEQRTGNTVIFNSAENGEIQLILDEALNVPVNSGRVLISGSAENGIRLDVRGDITASGAISASGTGSFGRLKSTGADITGSLHLTGSTSDLRVDGTVGIGTAAPTANNVMLHIKSNHTGLPTAIIEGDNGNSNANLEFKNTDISWVTGLTGGGYSDSFLIRSSSTNALYPFAIDPSAGGISTAPLLFMRDDKISILRGINPTANLHVSGNIVADGPNGHITASGAISASGTGSFGGGINLEDNQRINIGTSNDLLIYHEGNNSYIRDNGSGFLYIQASNSLVLESATGENYFKGDADGKVKLYYDNSEKLETTNVGVEITGGITASGDLAVSKKSVLGGTVYISGSIYSGSGTDVQTAGSEGEALVSLVLTGSVIPEGADKWSLGSPSNYFKELYLSEESVRFISSSGEVTQLRQRDVKDLREGRPVKQAVAIEGQDRFLRAQAIFHETASNHYIKQTTVGRWAFVGPSGTVLDIFEDGGGDNNIITLGNSTNDATKVHIPGNISASRATAPHIIGGTTRFGDGTVTINGPAGHITASGDISASGIITGLTGSFNNLSTSVQVDGFVSAMGIGTPTNITSNVNIPSNINALQFTNNTGDLTVPAGIDYTINTGATTSTPFLLDAVGGGAYMDGFLRINGNISASGLIEATSASFGNLSVSAFGDITSSGNISASGNIIANTLISNNIVFTSGSTSIKIEAPDENNNTAGSNLTLEAGNAFGPAFDGGDLILNAGKGSGAGTGGNITISTFGRIAGGSAVDSGSVTINALTTTINGDITSSGNISASGTIIASNFSGTTSGTNTGDQNLTNLAVTGSNVIFGNITSSNNISASGNITSTNISASGNLRVAGTGSFSNLVVDGNSGLTISSGAITGSIISGSTIIASQLTGSLSGNASGLSSNPNIAVTQITASATISSSGDIIANNLTISSRSDLTNLNVNGTLSSSGTISAISMSGDGSGLTGVTAEWDGSRNGNSNITGSLTILGGITASVGISSSTIITTEGVTLGNGSTDKHLITGNITSSGNLSSSGTITALTGSFSNLNINTFSNITSSGNISATGNISASGNVFGTTGSFTLLSATTASISHLIGNSPLTFGGADAFQFGSDLNLGINEAGGDVKLLNAKDVPLIEPLVAGTTSSGVQGSGRTEFGGNHEVELYAKGAVKILNVDGDDSNGIGSYILLGSGSINGSNLKNTDQHTIRFGSGSSHHPTLGDFYGGTDTIVFNTKIGHITASGNIIASTISSSNLSASNDLRVDGTGSFSRIHATSGSIAYLGIGAQGTAYIKSDASGIIEIKSEDGAKILLSDETVISGGPTTVGALTATTINTGQGNNELYDMDQDVLTTSNVKFGIVRITNNLINSGSTTLGNASADIHTITGNVTSSGNISSSGTITAATLSVATFTPTSVNTGNITGSNVSASGFLSASNIHTVGDVTLLGNISGSGTTSLTIGGNTTLNQITASGILSSSNNIIASQITASTFSGDGSGITGVTAEWDGTLNGDAQITGSLILSGSGDTNLNVLGDITGSNISASGTVYAQDIVASNTITGLGFNNPTSISTSTTVPAGYNSVFFVTNYNPSITVPAGIEYTISLGADVTLLNVTS